MEQSALNNILTRQKHDIATSLPDERQYLGDIRRSIQSGLATSTQFLMANPPTVDNLISRYKELIHKYSHPTWSFTVSARELTAPPDSTLLSQQVESTLGIQVDDYRTKQKRVLELYLSEVEQLLGHEKNFARKLQAIDELQMVATQIKKLESSDTLPALTDAMKNYITETFQKLHLQETYEELIASYGRFILLRGLTQLTEPTPIPSCTICMGAEVTHAITPCGHTFCEGCSKSQMTTCYICRTQIRDRLRLYFS